MSDQEVVPGWVYGLEEYQQIFDLNPQDFKRSILDFPGSISCFNAEASGKGANIVSADALYLHGHEQVSDFAKNLYRMNADFLKQNHQKLKYGEPALNQIALDWENNKTKFLADYSTGKEAGRYQHVLMPNLPYEDSQFDLALCSDYVFNRHVQNDCRPEEVILELCRVAREVRVFPLLNDAGDISEWLGPVMLELQKNNYGIEIRQVPFEVLKGGNAMLRVWMEA